VYASRLFSNVVVFIDMWVRRMKSECMERDTGSSVHEKRQSPFTVFRAVGMACGISNCLSYWCLFGCMVSLLYFTASGAVVNKAMHKAMLESYLVLVGLMFERMNEHHLLNCSKFRKRVSSIWT
jgi:hypothetical protein